MQGDYDFYFNPIETADYAEEIIKYADYETLKSLYASSVFFNKFLDSPHIVKFLAEKWLPISKIPFEKKVDARDENVRTFSDITKLRKLYYFADDCLNKHTNHECLLRAIKDGNTKHVEKYLDTKNIKFEIIKYALYYGRHDMIKYLFPYISSKNLSSLINEIVKIKDYELFLNVFNNLEFDKVWVLNLAAMYGETNIFFYLTEKGVNPDEHTLQQAIKSNSITIINYIMKNYSNEFPDAISLMLDSNVKYYTTEMLDIFSQYGFYPSSDVIHDYFLIISPPSIIIWLFDNKIIDNKSIYDMTVNVQPVRFDVIELLLDRDEYPPDYFACYFIFSSYYILNFDVCRKLMINANCEIDIYNLLKRGISQPQLNFLREYLIHSQTAVAIERLPDIHLTSFIFTNPNVNTILTYVKDDSNKEFFDDDIDRIVDSKTH